MKKIFLSIFCLLFLSAVSNKVLGQQVPDKNADPYKMQMQIYHDALKYNDVAVAKNALYNMRALNPGNAAILDSLAYLYYEYQQYASSLLVSRDILALNSNNLPAIEIQAISYEKLGLMDKALSTYETLYLKKDNPYTLYKIGLLQFDLKRHNESKTSLDILLKKPEIDSLNVVLNEKDNKQKQIPMRAALLNFQGLNNIQLGNKEEAKTNFEEALKLAPEYSQAKENLEGMK